LAVDQTILNEIAEGNYVIFDAKPTIISALGAIPKPDSSEVRLIHDCSYPTRQALNDYITSHSLSFQTLDDAIKLLRPNYYTAQIDLGVHTGQFLFIQTIMQLQHCSDSFQDKATPPIPLILVYHLEQKARQKFSTD